MLWPLGVGSELYGAKLKKMEPWLKLQGKQWTYKAFCNKTYVHACGHYPLSSFCSGKLEVFVPRPEMLNVIQIFFLKDITCHNVHPWCFRNMNLIFFVYRCNSLIGFDGKINYMLSVSVVKVVKTVWLTKCQTNSTPEIFFLTFLHIKI